ncbi:hypothetical protein BC829DRAFT_397210 [Chytridium lagenaria]|nr:hypothetical protein BC829DRAFT_397210 [Chytridium lagenaria]
MPLANRQKRQNRVFFLCRLAAYSASSIQHPTSNIHHPSYSSVPNHLFFSRVCSKKIAEDRI